jgi:hypothetical protein
VYSLHVRDIAVMQKRQLLCRFPEPNHVLNSLPSVAGTLRGKAASRPLAQRYVIKHQRRIEYG